MNYFLSIILVLNLSVSFSEKVIDKQSEFVKILSKCRIGSSDFDLCMKDSLNELRVYFEYGVPEFNIPSFDPFYAKEVVQKRGGSALNYKLTLRNIFESGWTNSYIYSFKSDLKHGIIKYHQWFPAKFLRGDWEFDSIFGLYENQGTFNLSLYNYTQVTTIRSKNNPNDSVNAFDVTIKAIDSGDMELHISNLLNGNTLEPLLDKVINFSWKPGFVILKPLIDDLVSTAFTKIFNDAFKNFPFVQVFQ